MAVPEKRIVPVEERSSGAPAPMALVPAMSIEQAVEQFRLYQELKEKLGTAEDFQEIRGRRHPKKSFVRKVQRFFNLSCELLRDEPIRDEKGHIIGWIATARAIHLPTGVYQDADGSCTFDEKTEGQRTIHNVRAHAVTRAKNRAILDLAGFGEVSAEEIVDDGAEGHQKDQQQRRDEPATQAQLKAIYALVRELGWNLDDAREYLKQRYGVDDSRKLTKRQASELIDYLRGIKEVDVDNGSGAEADADS